MNTDQQSPKSISAIRPLTEQELQIVQRGIRDFSEWFNAVRNVTPHDFAGLPDDLGTLDWVFYELGGSLWYTDHGFGFTCVWGNVLTRSFGFQWSTIGIPRDVRDCLLVHPVGYFLFPWQRLFEIVVNPGNQFTKAESTWLRIVTEVDFNSAVPDDWHPAYDAMHEGRSDVPAKVVALLADLYRRSPSSFFEALGLWPYDWNAETNWDQVQSRLSQLS